MKTKKTIASEYAPQVKICGLTVAEEAAACAQMGASAIGCVFYPPSPRHVSGDQAAGIVRALASSAAKVVGVFVDDPFDTIMKKVDKCGLHAVQLHGRESPDLVRKIEQEGVPVIKGLFVDADPRFSDARIYGASAFLTECAGGPLPGGNAVVWNWQAAAELSSRYPLMLAGGLTPENVQDAIAAARPDAVDVSSGVEAAPGRKDPEKVKRFMKAVSASRRTGTTRRIF